MHISPKDKDPRTERIIGKGKRREFEQTLNLKATEPCLRSKTLVSRRKSLHRVDKRVREYTRRVERDAESR